MNRKYWEVVARIPLGKWFQITVERRFVECRDFNGAPEPTGETWVEISPIPNPAGTIY